MPIADDLKKDCDAPDARKVKGVKELALKTEVARLCERDKRRAILAIVAAVNQILKEMTK